MLMKENEKLLTSPIPDFPYFPSAASNGFGKVLGSGSLRYGDWTAWQSCSTSCGLGGPGIENQWMMMTMMTMMAGVALVVPVVLVVLLLLVLVMVVGDSSLAVDDSDDYEDVAVAHDFCFVATEDMIRSESSTIPNDAFHFLTTAANQQTLLISWVPVLETLKKAAVSLRRCTICLWLFFSSRIQ